MQSLRTTVRPTVRFLAKAAPLAIVAVAAAAAAGIVAGGCRGWPQSVQEKRAYGDARLKAMGERLAGLQNFSFVADEYHLRSDLGQPGQASQPSDLNAASGELRKRDLVREVAFRRPDAAWFGARGDRGDQVWYAASTLTLASDRDRTWAEVPVPGSIDAALDDLGARIELLRPLTDLLSGALWDAALAPERAGGWVSIETIGKRNCDRVVYSQKSVDWQLWIEEGPNALPCQLMLVYKLEPGPARSTLIFRDWNLAADSPAERFQPAIPEGYQALGKLERPLAPVAPVAPITGIAPVAPVAPIAPAPPPDPAQNHS